MMKPILRLATVKDLTALQVLCKTIYPIHFGDYWEGPGLDRFLEDQFGTNRLTSDLEHPGIDYFFICREDKPVGFLKVYYQTSNKHFDSTSTAEIEKIYIEPEHIGKGLGAAVMQEMVDRLIKMGKSILILDVLDTNHKGIAFYERFGFIFHSKTRLTVANFKDHLRGLNLMYYPL